MDELLLLEELEVGSTPTDRASSDKTNEEVAEGLSAVEKETATLRFREDLTYPYFVVRLSADSQISSVTMDAIKTLMSSGTKEIKSADDLAKDSEEGTTDKVTVGISMDASINGVASEKVIGRIPKMKVRHLYSLVRNLNHELMLSEDRVFSGQKVLALL